MKPLIQVDGYYEEANWIPLPVLNENTFDKEKLIKLQHDDETLANINPFPMKESEDISGKMVF